MTETLIALLAAGLAGVFVWLFLQSRLAALAERLRARESESAQLMTEVTAARTTAAQLQVENGKLASDLAAERAGAEARLSELRSAHERLKAEFAELSASALRANRDDFLKLAQQTFAQIQEKSAGDLTARQQAIDTLLQPLRQQLGEFRTRIDTVYKTETDDRTALKAQIEQLRQLNARITDEAHALTQALKGQSQTRGAWGELILERLLENAGLRRGEEYVTQESLTTDDGRRLRPDVILRLPDQRDLVIDSKVSLIAYEQAVNAAEPAARDAALKAHAAAVRRHVEDLAGKRYEDTGRLFTPDYVLMFVPLESAFTTALETDPALYEWAFDRKVIIVTAPTLLVTLKTVALFWRQDRQTKNVQEIARRGGLLYDKFAGLYADLEEIGKHLGKARESYDDALGKLKTGPGNLLGQVEDLKSLGAKAKKALPATAQSE